MKKTAFDIVLPGWVDEFSGRNSGVFHTPEERMRLVVGLAEENVRRGTGGPFGAAVFDEKGCLVAPGINLVTTAKCSVLHAEIVAIVLAQKRLGRYDIGNEGAAYYELVASAEPCAMCLGAIPWSGVAGVVCGARDEDVRSIGFDEGEKPSNWQQALEARGIKVVRDVLRAEAAAVLRRYVEMGGAVYNAGITKHG